MGRQVLEWDKMHSNAYYNRERCTLDALGGLGNRIWVVIDRLTRMDHFVPYHTTLRRLTF